MIKNGQQELELQEHQQDAYNAVQKTYEQGNRAAVVIPTGCGKSFIALKLMEDNRDKNILFLAPTIAIKNQMYNYIAKYIVGEEPTSEQPARIIAKEHFPNLEIRLYQTLLKVSDEDMEKYHADIIIMDELHRTGAEKWGEKVNTLLEKNPNAKILGLTATPERMDEQNVIDKLFEGNISYELTLVEALRRRILKSPKYVKCDYALGEYIEGLKEAIDSCSDEKTKSELQKKVEQMRRIVEEAEGIPELFKNNIQKKDGKYIIFCKDKEHMELLKSKVSEWFGEIDSKPETYSVYSGKTERKNNEDIKKFETSKSEHLKLLFCVDMLNEGVHIEGVSGVIMARPTDSRIVYLQQLGRALSSDPSGEQTIIFDLVNNYVKNNLDAEVNGRNEDISHGNKENTIIGEKGEKSEKSQSVDIDIFKIQGETLKFLELLEEINGITGRSTYLKNAEAILEWIKRQEKPKLPSADSKNEEEKKLRNALNSIRTHLIKPYREKTTDEEREKFREKHPEVDDVRKIIKEIDISTATYYLNAQRILEWIKRQENPKKPSKLSENEEEKKLGNALSSIRTYLINPYMEKTTNEEREEFREKHPEIDDVRKIIKEIDISTATHYLNAQRILEWIKRQEKPRIPYQHSKNEEEKKLGTALQNIRSQLIKPYMEKPTDEEREQFREEHPETDAVLEIVSDIDIKYGTKKQKELAELIKRDLEKRRELDEARKLEEQYEQLVADTKDKKNGVDFNGE